MANWLLKTEPSEFSWADLTKAKKARWDGVSNALALKHLRTVAVGDRVMIYHTGDERAVVGLAEVVRAAYPDPAAEDEKLVVIDIEPREPLPRPVTLAAIKADPLFEGFDLLKNGRLSVVPVPAAMWRRVVLLGRAK